MKHLFIYFLLSVLLALPSRMMAQINKWQDVYEVKKKDTLFGIARKYSISLQDLLDANPEMKAEGYELKKGTTIFIPHAKTVSAPVVPAKTEKKEAARSSTVKIGVMLPLHDVDGDGRRMVEYYRGLLLACDSLKSQGISTEIRAWNVPIDADIRQTLLDQRAKDCNLIFGPLYTHQVKPLADFCSRNGIKLIIPFSINGDEVVRNSQVFQVYQDDSNLTNDAIAAYMQRFPGCHPVFIDCNDSTSKKGIFTFGLRKVLDQKGIRYNITNLKSSEASFAKSFSRTMPNVVILNTGRSPELNVALAKIDGLTAVNPDVKVILYGYTEWLMYTRNHLEHFFRYNAYIPSTFYYNPLDPKTLNFERSYRKWFGSEMQQALPRFAITGYDQAQFFVRGYHRYGDGFNGTREQNSYRALQTPLHFKRLVKGMQNANFMLIHYTPDQRIESISY
ncbi:MAG: LysM peptidoglycan-binding domain-containing protein [Prevotella sp.]|nr:LysM peptidoglycan-binding domain-containing protein [Prevotella sp.]